MTELIPGLPKASVSMGDGGANDPQITFTADDTSCRWNGFPVCIEVVPEYNGPIPEVDAETDQLKTFQNPAGAGTGTPTTAEWPYANVRHYLDGILEGCHLEARVTGNASGATSLGDLGVIAVGGGLLGSAAGPWFGDFDTGWFALTNGSCTTAPDNIQLALGFDNFSPITATGVAIKGGRFFLRWVCTGAPIAAYMGGQVFTVEWRPPCWIAQSSSDLDAGLYIHLATTRCGAIDTTYTNIRDAVNALSLGLTATLPGGHGADHAKPDPACPFPDYCCDMTGAECTGTVDMY